MGGGGGGGSDPPPLPSFLFLFYTFELLYKVLEIRSAQKEHFEE